MRLRFNKFLEYIISSWRQQPQLLLTLFYFIGSVALTDNKTFFAWSILFFLALFFVTNSFFESLVFSFFPMSLFNIGQLYQYIVVPQHAESGRIYQPGRSLYFTLSPFYLFLVICMVAIPLLILKMRSKLSVPISFALFLLVCSLGLFSAYKSSVLPTLSILYLSWELGVLSWGLIVFNYCKNSKKKRTIFSLLLIQIMLALLFHSSIVLLQTIKRSSLGLKIEQTEQIPYFGLGADENANQFRPIGLRGDANTLGNDFLILLSCFLLIWVYLEEKENIGTRNIWLSYTTGIVLVVILLCQSRSIYLGMAGGLTLLFLTQMKRLIKYTQFVYKKLEPYKYTIFLLVFFLSLMVGDRLWRSKFSFSESGGFTVRNQLITEATAIIQQNWWWGVGSAMFIPTAYRNDPYGVMSYFPESVHNGFYLFLSERGALTAMATAVAIYWVTRRIWKAKTSDFFKWVYASLLLAQFIAMLFQPFNNFISYYIVLSLILAEVKSYE